MLLNTTDPRDGSVSFVKLSASPSGSLSFVATVDVTAVAYGVVAVSFTATGDGLLTFNVKVAVTKAPKGSVTVTETV